MHGLTSILASSEGSSEVPYFIAGGLFAAWAIVISLIGLRRHDFPSGGAGRGLILVTVLLAAATLGTLIAVTS